MQDEVVIGYTANYAAPEVAKAVIEGNDEPARTTMDIFSLGLVALEMLRGAPLIPASSSKEEALRTLCGDELNAALSTATKQSKAAKQRAAMLGRMLQVSPNERTAAVDLINLTELESVLNDEEEHRGKRLIESRCTTVFHRNRK